MWQVQITLAMRRYIWLEASLDPVERAVPLQIKATASTRELSLPVLTSTHVEAASPVLAPCTCSFINHVVTLSQVLHIAQDDLFDYYSKM